jgi:hypothetical protein
MDEATKARLDTVLNAHDQQTSSKAESGAAALARSYMRRFEKFVDDRLRGLEHEFDEVLKTRGHQMRVFDATGDHVVRRHRVLLSPKAGEAPSPDSNGHEIEFCPDWRSERIAVYWRDNDGKIFGPRRSCTIDELSADGAAEDIFLAFVEATLLDRT